MTLPEFDMDAVGKFSVIVTRRGQGATTLLTQLCRHKLANGIDRIIAFDPCHELVPSGLKDLVRDEQSMYKELTEELLMQILQRQKQLLRKSRKNNEHVKVPKLLLAIDNAYFASGVFRSQAFRTLVFNGRCMGIEVIMTQQFLPILPKPIRANVDTWFFAGTPSTTDQRRMYEHCCGQLPTFQSFQQVLHDATQNYSFLVSSNNKRDHSLNLFWHKASFAQKTVHVAHAKPAPAAPAATETETLQTDMVQVSPVDVKPAPAAKTIPVAAETNTGQSTLAFLRKMFTTNASFRRLMLEADADCVRRLARDAGDVEEIPDFRTSLLMLWDELNNKKIKSAK